MRGAAARLIQAGSTNPAGVGDLRAQYFYALADVVRMAGESGLSSTLADRAQRIWAYSGIRAQQLEMSSAAPDADVASRSTSKNIALRVADSMAAAINVAFSPKLLAAEVQHALKLLMPAANVIIRERLGAAGAPLSHPDDVFLELGKEHDKHIAVVCDSPATPEAAVAICNVFGLARAAVALERYRQEECNRPALWPADPIETEAGALFLAEEMQNVLAIARRVASTPVPVLITGETGTGKEVLARVIHAYSKRAKASFLPFNCSAVPKDMLDAQLFGHRRGAFTGAVDSFQGVIRGAAGGTLFLDEIGETTLDVQPKLLRFLESSEVHPIGELQPVKVDVRVIAATNADLEALVSEGRFRDDLFYRLNIVRLHIPPLRERRVEIPALAHHYLQKTAQEYAKGDLRLAEETMEYLVLYRWPGNVRQLANEIRRMAALAEPGAVLMPEHLSPEIAASRRTIPPSERVLEPTEIVVRLDQPMPAALQHVEQAMIRWGLKQTGGGMEETAALLGISRKGLYLKRVRFGIDPPAGPAEADIA
jgi:DNA-binding NtrC family response regulator